MLSPWSTKYNVCDNNRKLRPGPITDNLEQRLLILTTWNHLWYMLLCLHQPGESISSETRVPYQSVIGHVPRCVSLHLTHLPGQNGRHFTDICFKCISWLKSLTGNKSILVQVMAWRMFGAKQLPKPMPTISPTHVRHKGGGRLNCSHEAVYSRTLCPLRESCSAEVVLCRSVWLPVKMKDILC